jgi:hypothetical protein
MKLALLDPDTSGGRMPLPCAVVVNGQVLKSPAMKRLLDDLVRGQLG